MFCHSRLPLLIFTIKIFGTLLVDWVGYWVSFQGKFCQLRYGDASWPKLDTSCWIWIIQPITVNVNGVFNIPFLGVDYKPEEDGMGMSGWLHVFWFQAQHVSDIHSFVQTVTGWAPVVIVEIIKLFLWKFWKHNQEFLAIITTGFNGANGNVDLVVFSRRHISVHTLYMAKVLIETDNTDPGSPFHIPNLEGSVKWTAEEFQDNLKPLLWGKKGK